jgi:hypothetical protein
MFLGGAANALKGPMRIRRLFSGMGIFVFAWILSAKAQNECLGCHGPFSDLIKATTNYVAPSGEKVSPHRYVPHDSKEDENIPQCTQCHTAHALDPLPSKGSIDVSKISVQWCYTSCHHQKNFTPCKTCHGADGVNGPQ